MATNIPKSTQQVLDKNTVIEGTFKGDLQGNADTATALQNNFSVTLTGDATGSFTTHGNSTQLPISVNRARTAENADHAKTADSVAFANTSGNATYATTAGHASTSAQATVATTADQAGHALTSHKADLSDKAINADFAKHAELADTATKAINADFADIATTANSLAIDAVVPSADYASRAGIAEIAQYDCDGLSIKDFYAKKTEIPKDQLTIAEGDARYIKREEKLLQAVVQGKASGIGAVLGNTLNIEITSLDAGENNLSIYDKLVFIDTEELPQPRDTTKVYITKSYKMWVYNQGIQDFVEITSSLDVKIAKQIEEALEKLKTAVNTTDNQEIRGTKTFKEVVYGGIPSLTADNDKALATVHNILDIQKDITDLDKSVKEKIEELIHRLDAQEKGDVVFALVDYSIKLNQATMTVGTRYLTLLTEAKEYIQISADTNLPEDPTKVPFYYRYYVKGTNGKVTYADYRINVDLSDYARLDGAEFTGIVKVADLATQNLDELKAVKDTRVINTKQLHQLLDDKATATSKEIEKVDDKVTALTARVDIVEPKVTALETRADNVDVELSKLMPKAGGTFTGNVAVPNQADLANATADAVLNKTDTQSLIDTAVTEGLQNAVVWQSVTDENQITKDGLYFVIA